MKNIVVIRYNEIALKKGNREFFERKLIENLNRVLKDLPVSVKRRFGRVIVEIDGEVTEDVLKKQIGYVFGVDSFSFGVSVETDMEVIGAAAIELLRSSTGPGPVPGPDCGYVRKWETFKVETQRTDKTFPLKSPEISKVIGAVVFKAFPDKGVKMKDPDVTLNVEIGNKEAYVTAGKIRGPGGLPVGTAGKVLCLLSGGIDSPVAAWYMMKRGCKVDYVHFHSIPYTDRASVQKVEELAEILEPWQGTSLASDVPGSSTIVEIPLLEIQKKIMTETNEKYRVLLYRRFMFRMAEAVARTRKAKALITGESLGQVASQTLENMTVVEDVVELPVLRPLIGFDKQEIITVAKRIGTYETSIIPHGDCCSLFQPRHPSTKAKLEDIRADESQLSINELISGSMDQLESKTI